METPDYSNSGSCGWDSDPSNDQSSQLQQVLDLLMNKLHFNFEKYSDGERMITACLTERGYTNIRWYMGECDSFGPLSRVLKAKTPEGADEEAWYG